MTIIESQEYKNLVEAREFLRAHRVRVVNEICAPAWRFLAHAQDHLDRQLSELTVLAFHAPDTTEAILHSTASLDPQFAKVPRA